MVQTPLELANDEAARLDPDTIWKEIINRKYRPGPYPVVRTTGHALALLCQDRRDDRTRSRLTLGKYKAPWIKIEFYRHMQWVDGVQFLVFASVVEDLLNGRYLEAIPGQGLIYPLAELPDEVHYRVSRNGRNALQTALAGKNQKAAPY